MASQESKPLSTPPPTTSTPPPNTPPIRPELGGPSPADAQKKRIIMIAGGSLFFLAIVGAVPFVALSGSKKKAATSPSPSASATPKPSSEPNLSRDQTSRLSLRSGGTSLIYDMSLTAPLGWNASFTTSPSSPSYPWNGTVLITALKSSFSPLSAGNVNVASSNFLAIMDSVEWLKTAQASPAMSAEQKQAWFAATSALTSDTIASAAGLANPVTTSDQGRINLTYVQTQDASQHGFAYLTQPSAGRYEPAAITLLAGKIGGRSVILYGRHAIRDKQWSTLANLQSSGDKDYTTQRDSAITAFAAGTISDDTGAIYKELLKVISSMKFVAAN